MRRCPTICGIRVQIKNKRLRKAIRDVLLAIQERRPKDLTRLRSQVRAIVPLSDEEAADGTSGEWKPTPVDPADFPWGMIPYELEMRPPGEVAVWEGLEESQLVATLAHEFGHACTTSDVLERRNATSDEWASELAADWYAYKWGFGRQIARARKGRDHVHHCAGPGQIVEEFYEDNVRVSRVTRNLCMRLVETRKGEARRRPKRWTSEQLKGKTF